MPESTNQTLVDAEGPGNPIPLIALASAAGVNCVVEVWVCDMDFVRVYADDRPLQVVSIALQIRDGTATYHIACATDQF